ncbi:mannose-binding protein c [Plakobranchus ocellatus]|uniref:Mannose-binding protein c n=1 Tax=Plakobranchus ocellatus TaxID=259542 RepID=A0AAV3Z1V9_9GAST|nr:mannose-binding protein c [Plakobranchus ocellatus]
MFLSIILPISKSGSSDRFSDPTRIIRIFLYQAEQYQILLHQPQQVEQNLAVPGRKASTDPATPGPTGGAEPCCARPKSINRSCYIKPNSLLSGPQIWPHRYPFDPVKLCLAPGPKFGPSGPQASKLFYAIDHKRLAQKTRSHSPASCKRGQDILNSR